MFQVKEAVELPLTHFDLYKQIGIDPPRGVLMYGPPGCGKTMLAKAVAHHTTASFIRVVGSEFVQKYLGEGPRMVSLFDNPTFNSIDGQPFCQTVVNSCTLGTVTVTKLGR